jgi:hypothetical protein
MPSGVELLRELKMNQYRLLTIIILLIIPSILLGQRINPPKWDLEELNTPYSNHTETFAEAFKDPNILIGVFESPDKPSDTILSSGESILSQPGYREAANQYILRILHFVKNIKGSFPEPVVVVVGTGLTPMFEGRPIIPPLSPVSGSKWILALKKTSSASRLERFGKDIEKYPFLNDRTMFVLFRFGYGTLCLKWPEGRPEQEGIKKVPESMIDDLEAIVKVMPSIQKEKKDPNDTAAIDKTSKALKNDLAKSIFTKVSSQKLVKVKDPNDKSK